MLFDGNRAEVVKRCAAVSQFMGNGPCELGFIDQNGHVQGWLDIQSKLDLHLASAPPSSSVRKTWRDYRIHILTISPLVALAVPDPKSGPNWCSVPVRGNCIISTKSAGFFYGDNDAMNLVPGSFWFSPDLNQINQPIPENVASFRIDLPDSKIDLIANGTVWQVKRTAR